MPHDDNHQPDEGLQAAIDRVRHDPNFTALLAALVARDEDILDLHSRD